MYPENFCISSNGSMNVDIPFSLISTKTFYISTNEKYKSDNSDKTFCYFRRSFYQECLKLYPKVFVN